jgi:hypothetical protein
MKYFVVLFKNKEKRKIIKKFKTYDRAISYYEKQIQENSIVFDKAIENGKSCKFELGLLEKDSMNFDLYFVRDEMGRQVKVESDDPEFKILRISPYKKEEKLFDLQRNKKITFDFLVKRYLNGSGIKLISKLNHKIIVQNDDDYKIFSLKSDEDCERFILILRTYMFEKKRTDCIIVADTSVAQKKYLYEVLEKKGFSKSVLYRRATTFIKE